MTDGSAYRACGSHLKLLKLYVKLGSSWLFGYLLQTDCIICSIAFFKHAESTLSSTIPLYGLDYLILVMKLWYFCLYIVNKKIILYVAEN